MNVDGNPRFLPEEIITNILKRLPVKSLIRFQCVSKHWKNLIKNPSFIQNHLTHQNPSLLIEHCPGDDDLWLFDCEMQFHYLAYPPSIDSFGDFVALRTVGSCNGLICMVNYERLPPAPLLWNPATREVRQMPVITHDDIYNCWHFGFGFSPFDNDYKIVRGSRHKVEMYSLTTGSWKDIGFDNIIDVTILDDGVTVNGVMFWYGTRRQLDGNNKIISLDLATEVFTVMPLPALVNHVDGGVNLAVCEDKLALIYLPELMDPPCACIYLWVMEEGVRGSSEERWSLRRKYVRNTDPVKLHAGTIWRNQVVYIWRNQVAYIDYELPRVIAEPEAEKENVEPKCGIHLINVTTNEHKRFAIPERGYFGAYRFSSVYHYMESLVLTGSVSMLVQDRRQLLEGRVPLTFCL